MQAIQEEKAVRFQSLVENHARQERRFNHIQELCDSIYAGSPQTTSFAVMTGNDYVVTVCPALPVTDTYLNQLRYRMKRFWPGSKIYRVRGNNTLQVIVPIELVSSLEEKPEHVASLAASKDGLRPGDLVTYYDAARKRDVHAMVCTRGYQGHVQVVNLQEANPVYTVVIPAVWVLAIDSGAREYHNVYLEHGEAVKNAVVDSPNNEVEA